VQLKLDHMHEDNAYAWTGSSDAQSVRLSFPRARCGPHVGDVQVAIEPRVRTRLRCATISIDITNVNRSRTSTNRIRLRPNPRFKTRKPR
jgi:hypothetical protein